MKKVFIVGRAPHRERIVEAVRSAGVLHLVPVDVARVAPDGQHLRLLERLERGAAVLDAQTPAGAPLNLSPEAAADEAAALDKTRSELTARQEAIPRLLEEQATWGEVRLEDIHRLHAADLHVVFVTVPAGDVPHIHADLVQPLGELPGDRLLVGVAGLRSVELPQSADVLELPAADRPTLRAEAATNAQRLGAIATRLGQLAHARGALRDRAQVLRAEAELSRVVAGALNDDVFFGLQGWVPADGLEAVRTRLAEGQLAAVLEREPGPDELPPTLVRPPAWARPIMGVMQVLGITPGYREADVSIAFMVALPLFAAMLISDAGYSALILLAPLLLWKRTVAAVGRPLAQFVVVIGAAGVIWGLLTGAVFGVDVVTPLTGRPPPIVVTQEDVPMQWLMRLSFTIGVVHLSIAQLWSAALLWPDRTALGKVGWAAFLWGMYGVVTMFVLKTPLNWQTPWPWLLACGGAFAVLFGAAGTNVFKAVALGFANFPLSALSTFSDIMSYVRLMAVGLAGSVLAVSFNELALSSGPVLLVPILIAGHALNLGLCLIALFAHGVRLNVLEFSNNFGLEWSGFRYEPLASEITSQQALAPATAGGVANNQES